MEREMKEMRKKMEMMKHDADKAAKVSNRTSASLLANWRQATIERRRVRLAVTGQERLIRSHSSTRFSFELSVNNNKQCILNMK